MHAFDMLARTVFALAGGALMLLALGLVVGLGIYQRLSAKVEITAGEVGAKGRLG